MIIDPSSPDITEDIFEKLKDEKEFGEIIRREFDQNTSRTRLEPKYSLDLLRDAYQSYQWDVKRLDDSPSPDYFKLSGYLVYWLQRNSPIVEWKETEEEYKIGDEEIKEFRKFVYEYGRVYHPFLLGYRICWFFELNTKAESSLPRVIDRDYLATVCSYIKYKNVSPHALRLIYRSLFFV